MGSLRALRWVAVAAPLAFVVGLGLVLHLVLLPALTDAVAFAVAGSVAALGIVAFAWFIFSMLERMQVQLERRAEEWRSLFELGQEVTASPDVDGLLESVVERARHLLQADVAVLMLLDPTGQELHLAAQRGLKERGGAWDPLPANEGPQGLVVRMAQPLVVSDCRREPLLEGRPAVLEGVELGSLVAVPFSAKGKMLGVLLVGNRAPTPLGRDQAQLLAAFANWAAVAVETSRLYDRMRSLALLEERERIAMDLHDGVIQSLYAVALSLEAAGEEVEEGSPVRWALERAIDDLDRVIRDLRHYIYDLRPASSQVGDLRRAVRELLEEARATGGLEVRLEAEGPLPPLREEEALGIYHVAQEAISNVIKHAQANHLVVRLAYHRPTLILEVADDGVGFDPQAPRDRTRQGMRNMADRARALDARLVIDSAPGRGTHVRLEVPIREGEA
jgi:two-component system sensor histidine kinase DevS